MNNIRFFTYIGEHYDNESPEKIEGLYEKLPYGTVAYFNEDLYEQAYEYSVDKWTTASYVFDLGPEMYIGHEHDIHSSDVILKGSFGDEVFWHEPRAAMSVAIHELGSKSLEECHDMLKDYYAYQPHHMNQWDFDRISAAPDMDRAILGHHYNRQFSYLKDDRVLMNQMVISPFIDIRLRNLLPLCDRKTKVDIILNASLQKAIISERWKPFLNDTKAGGEESFTRINVSKYNRKQVAWFLKNRGTNAGIV